MHNKTNMLQFHTLYNLASVNIKSSKHFTRSIKLLNPVENDEVTEWGRKVSNLASTPHIRIFIRRFSSLKVWQ